MPGRSTPGRVRSLIVVAATAAPVWPGADHGLGLLLFHQINGAADRGIFLAADGLDRFVRHLDHLGGMDDLDPAIIAAELFQFALDLRGIAHEEELVDARVFPQGHDRAAHEIGRPEIAAHGIECDFHWCGSLRVSRRECNPPAASARACGTLTPPGCKRRRKRTCRRELGFDRQDLAALVIAARRAGRVRTHRAAALWALVELRGFPTMRSLARAQAHLGCFAFWDSHKSRIGKQGIAKPQIRVSPLASALRGRRRFSRRALSARALRGFL